jgi:hypothetical protein
LTVSITSSRLQRQTDATRSFTFIYYFYWSFPGAAGFTTSHLSKK